MDHFSGGSPDRHRLAFPWLAARAARISRKSDLAEAMAHLLRPEEGFRRWLDKGRVDIASNLVANAIRSPAMNR